MIAVQAFHYERVVRAAGQAIVQIVPDGAMWAHARPVFQDLRVVDARGAQVPWREVELPPRGDYEAPLDVIDSGRRGALAVARVRTSAPLDRLTLVVPDKRFVGIATAYGSSDGRTWTEVGATQIYSVGGAKSAESTAVLLRPNDFRYLEIRATHVTRILRVTVHETRNPNGLARVPARVRVRGAQIVVDVRHANVPVDELRISSTTPRYDRPYTVVSHGVAVASGRLVRLGRPALTIVPVDATGRYIRVVVANGNDPPLHGIRVTAYARPVPIQIEGGHPGPLRLYYGAHIGPPTYDFARLPVRGAVQRAALGPERLNPRFHVVDRRSFFAKHRSLVTVALALAAALLVAAGAFALRKT
jgi:hypothetical protein